MDHRITHTERQPRVSMLGLVRHSVFMAVGATVLAGAASASSQVLSDPGLNSDTSPLLSFTTNNVYNRWLQENSVLVVGAENGVTPYAGDGMLRMAKASLSLSEIRQRVDVSAMAAEIDAGIVCMSASVMLNPTVAGVSASARALAFDAGGALLGSMGDPCLSPDGDVSTWEKSTARLMLPPGTRFVESRPAANNASLPSGDFVYMDEADCNIFVTLDPQALTDPGLDSTTQPLLSFTTNNVYDRWLQENSALVVGTENGVTPYGGDGMLRMAKAGLSLSEIRQRVDVSAMAATIDAGLMSMSASVMLNPTIGGVASSARAFAFDGSGALLASAGDPCSAPDGDVLTWEKSTAVMSIPVGTRFVEIRPSATNSTLPVSEYVYMDEANITIKAAPVCFTDVCPGLAGTFGEPELSAQVSLGPNAVGDLLLANALQNSPAALFVGLGPAGAGAAFKGGTLKPVPWLLLLTGLNTDSLGELTLPLNIGVNLGPLSLVFQYGILDGAAVNGVSLSNALQMDML